MPKPASAGQRYMPGLDGARAIAVTAVVAYHLGVPWAPGGLLGVGVFFTLSGYLITDILLSNWESSGSLQLRRFWAARARRLLPALTLMLAVVVVWVALAQPAQLGQVRGDVLAAAAYVSNWWLVVQHVSYFARFGPPSPLGHLWSLAVEEQFYLVWPWLLWAGLAWSARRKAAAARRRAPGHVDVRARARQQFWPLAAITVLVATASAVELAVLYHPTLDPSRLYDGTDTRAFALLAGAALAMVWPSKGLRADLSRGARQLVDALGGLGLIVIALLVALTNQYSAFIYRGGMVLLSLATVLVVAAAAHPASRWGRVLGWGPLRWVGVRSYGIYLWHYPVIVLTSPTVTNGVDLGRAALQVGATLVLATVSWRWVEMPVRQGALGRLWRALWPSPRAWLAAAPARRFAAFGLGLSLALEASALLGAIPDVGAQSASVLVQTAPPSSTVASPPVTVEAPTTTASSAGKKTGAKAGSRATPATTTTVPGAGAAEALRTTCRQVLHIGDSTSESLTSSDYLPDPAQRLGAQYARVGVQHSVMRISGGRSVVETIDNQPNAYDIAKSLVKRGYRGCWVIALGTNDAANIYVGSSINAAARVARMMSVIGNEPVLWVNVKTLLSTGPYSEADMAGWDRALVAGCSRYPNMRVFNWAGMAKTSWFTSDGIHYTSQGSAPRAAAIADALATAFPQARSNGGHTSGEGKGAVVTSPGCVINGSSQWHLPTFRF